MNNAKRSKNEFTPKKWRDLLPFKKIIKHHLPFYNVEELKLLSTYFDDSLDISITGSVASGVISVQSTPANLSFFGSTVISMPSLIAGSPLQLHPPKQNMYRVNFKHFESIESFHKLLKEDPARVAPFQIPFRDLPLHLNDSISIYYAPWFNSVIAWRLRIGR